MSSHTPAPLTIPQIATLFAVIPLIIVRATYHFLTHLPTPPSAKSLKIQLIKSLARNAAVIPLPLAQSLQAPTGTAVRSHCSKHGIPHHATPLPTPGFADATLHTLTLDPNSRSRKATLLYLHGGGYSHPISRSHIPWSIFLARTVNANLAILEYTIAPKGRYPTQLAQTVSAISHLLASHSPEEIVIAGDSAGGNLALGLLAHIKTPAPNVSPLAIEEGKLRGVLAISPRCSSSTASASFEAFDGIDIVGSHTMPIFNTAWRPRPELWAEPALAGREFWGDELAAGGICIVVGGAEVYVDDARQVAIALGAEGAVAPGDEIKGRKWVEAQGECHVQPGLEYALGILDGKGLRGCVEFLQGV